MNKKQNPYRLYLTEDQMPKQYYNLRADMKELPEPMLNPMTKKEATLEDLLPVFCKELAKQELDNETRYNALKIKDPNRATILLNEQIENATPNVFDSSNLFEPPKYEESNLEKQTEDTALNKINSNNSIDLLVEKNNINEEKIPNEIEPSDADKTELSEEPFENTLKRVDDKFKLFEESLNKIHELEVEEEKKKVEDAELPKLINENKQAETDIEEFNLFDY